MGVKPKRKCLCKRKRKGKKIDFLADVYISVEKVMNGTFSLAAFKYIQNVQMMNTSANHAAPGAFHYTIIAVALGKLRY